MYSFGGGFLVVHLCEVILNLDQWFRRCQTKTNYTNSSYSGELKQQLETINRKKVPKGIIAGFLGNQLKRTWHHMKEETLKKACVKFEASRLNTLRENRHF